MPIYGSMNLCIHGVVYRRKYSCMVYLKQLFVSIKGFLNLLIKFFDSGMFLTDNGSFAQIFTPENFSDFFPNSVLAFIKEKQEFCLNLVVYL